MITRNSGVKRVLSAMLAVVMSSASVISVPVAAYSDDRYEQMTPNGISDEWDGTVATSFAGGCGTYDDPYQIETAEQLALLSQKLQSEDEYQRYSGSCYELMDDIVLNNDVYDLTEINEWTPIGAGIYYEEENAFMSTPFGGIFNGNGHTISGLYISADADEEMVGLFGECEYAEINDLKVSGWIDVDSCSKVGGICGFGDDTTFRKCVNNVKVFGGEYVGGICGWGSGDDLLFDNCENKGNIYGASEVGGICGLVSDDGAGVYQCINSGIVGSDPDSDMSSFGGIVGLSSGDITFCENKGTVYGPNGVGGIIGANWESVLVEWCKNSGTVKSPANDTTFSIGGICGSLCINNYGGSPCEAIIRDSHNDGTITIGEGGSLIYVGGIVGKIDGTGGASVYNCYNNSDIVTQATEVGGICGIMAGYDKVENDIQRCYNIGTIHAYYESNGDKMSGGICGKMEAGLIRDCFNLGEIKSTYWSSGIVGMIMDSENGYCEIYDCYNAGKCANKSSPLVQGDMMADTFGNLYFDKDVCQAADVIYYGYAPTQTGKTTAQLTASSVITDLGFDPDAWKKNQNDAYALYYPDIVSVDDDYIPCKKLSEPKPAILSATPDDGKVTLSWQSIASAEKYRVFVYEGTSIKKYVDTTASSNVIAGLTNGTKYGFLVRALIDGAWTAYTASDIVYATPVGASKPTGVSVAAADGCVRVSWNELTDASKYRVFVYEGTTIKKYVDTYIASATVTDLVNGTRYGFLVRALVNGTWTPYTASDIVYATPVASGKPENVKVTAVNASATVTWDAVKGATSYRVFLYSDGLPRKYIDTTATTAAFTGLINGTRYGFLVRALVNGAWTNYTSSDLVYATPYVVDKPYGLKAVPGDGMVSLTWSPVTGATGYRVFVYDGNSITQYNDTTSNAFTVHRLTNGKKYGFLVRTQVNGVWSSYTAADIVYAVPEQDIKPESVKAYGGDESATVTWSAVSGATQYRVFVYRSGDIIKYVDTKYTTVVIAGLTNDIQHGFLVRAFVNGVWTTYTNRDIVYATPAAEIKPTNIKTDYNNGEVTVTWDGVEGASKYRVFVYYNNSIWQYVDSTSECAALPGFERGVAYGFLVRAVVNGKWSSYTPNDVNYFVF